jgi:hypothetical protein
LVNGAGEIGEQSLPVHRGKVNRRSGRCSTVQLAHKSLWAGLFEPVDATGWAGGVCFLGSQKRRPIGCRAVPVRERPRSAVRAWKMRDLAGASHLRATHRRPKARTPLLPSPCFLPSRSGATGPPPVTTQAHFNRTGSPESRETAQQFSGGAFGGRRDEQRRLAACERTSEAGGKRRCRVTSEPRCPPKATTLLLTWLQTGLTAWKSGVRSRHHAHSTDGRQ